MPVSIVIAYLAAYLPVTVGKAVLVDSVLQHQRRRPIGVLVASYAVVYILEAAVYLFNPFANAGVVINLMCSIITVMAVCLFCYQGTVLMKLLASVFTMVGAVGETIAIGVIMVVLKISMDDFVGNVELMTIGTLLSGLIITVLLLLISMLFRQKGMPDNKLPKAYLVAAVLSSGGSTAIIAILVDSALRNVPVYGASLLSIFVILLVFNAFVFYLYRGLLRETENRYRNLLLERQGQAYANELQLAQKSAQEVWTIRHDLKNHALAVREMLNSGSVEDAIKYIDEGVQLVESTASFASSGCVALDSVLNYKLSEAERAGAQIELSVIVPTDLRIDALDLNIIFGNLLDNAIEGLLRADEKKLSVDVSFEKGVLLFKVENTYDGIAIKTYTDNPVYKTRKEQSEQHGLGLASVARVLEKYNGMYEIKDDNNVFCYRAMLYETNEVVGKRLC